MKRMLAAVLLAFSVPLFGLELMPVPALVSVSAGKLRVTGPMPVFLSGPDGRVGAGVDRFLDRLSGRTATRFARVRAVSPDNAFLSVSFSRRGKNILYEDESYSLSVSSVSAVLHAETDIGVLRGLETLLQLLESDGEGYYFSAAKIIDGPRFAWRGLMIDVSRHFMPEDAIRRNIDAMAAVKMNVLHLHLTDSQGFRVESRVFPKLQAMGSDGEYYTQEQIRGLVSYASDRGIRIVPEFDIPGHCAGWLAGYPELGSAPGPYSVDRYYGVSSPVLNPADERIYKFLKKFFAEMAGLFPDEYVHIGGDEVWGRDWDSNPEIRRFMKSRNMADKHALQAYFNTRVSEILAEYGKKVVGWDEIMNPAMPKNIVIQSWQGKELLAKSAREGYMGLLSKDYYLDIYKPASFYYLNDPLDEKAGLSAGERRRVLGGEATMWAEFVTRENLDERIWPRTAAIAERLWSQPGVNDVDDMYRRLETTSLRLEELGLQHKKNYGMMLRRLAGGDGINALQTLADVLEPVKDWWRFFREVEYSSDYPYTRLVDAVRAESSACREFRRKTDAFISGGSGDGAIRGQLAVWAANDELLRPVIASSPALKEAAPLSAALSSAARAGLASLDVISAGRRLSGEEIAAQEAVLASAETDYGQAELCVVEPIRKLAGFAAKAH